MRKVPVCLAILASLAFLVSPVLAGKGGKGGKGSAGHGGHGPKVDSGNRGSRGGNRGGEHPNRGHDVMPRGRDRSHEGNKEDGGRVAHSPKSDNRRSDGSHEPDVTSQDVNYNRIHIDHRHHYHHPDYYRSYWRVDVWSGGLRVHCGPWDPLGYYPCYIPSPVYYPVSWAPYDYYYYYYGPTYPDGCLIHGFHHRGHCEWYYNDVGGLVLFYYP